MRRRRRSSDTDVVENRQGCDRRTRRISEHRGQVGHRPRHRPRANRGCAHSGASVSNRTRVERERVLLLARHRRRQHRALGAKLLVVRAVSR